MNKLEIICYIISAFFMGISAGCFIAGGVHKAVYGGKIKPLKPRGFRAWLSRIRRKRKPPILDEMHEHRDDTIQEALKQGLSAKTCQVQTHLADAVGFLTLEHDTGELRPTCEEDLRNQCARRLVNALTASGAIRFTFKREDELPFSGMPKLRCIARVDAVILDNKEEPT